MTQTEMWELTFLHYIIFNNKITAIIYFLKDTVGEIYCISDHLTHAEGDDIQ